MSAHLPGGRCGAVLSAHRLLHAFPFLLVLVALGALGSWLGVQIDPASWSVGHRIGPMWFALAAAYVVLLALPFVPAIEIGLAIMLMLGSEGVLLVYLCTQVGLSLGFAGGRMVSTSTMAALLRKLRLRDTESLLERLRTGFGPCVVPRHGRWFARALQHRYVALALILNTPGNAALGGAGGIAFLAGASRLYSFPRFCVLVAVATIPLPALMLLSAA